MANYTWTSAVSGDWNTAADWSGGVVPGLGDTAVINVPGTYTVTISKPLSVNSLTLNAAGATVLDNAAVTLGGVLDVANGTFAMAATGAAITGGTIINAGGTFNWNAMLSTGATTGGLLSNLTFEGPLNVSGQQAVTVSNVTFTGAGGTGPGVINLTDTGAPSGQGGYSGTLWATGLLDNVTINGSGAAMAVYNPADKTPVLTLGSNAHLVAGADGILIETVVTALGGESHADNQITNNGSISFSAANSYIGTNIPNLTNNGSINVALSGDEFDSQYATSIVNASTGVISASGAGSTIRLRAATSFVNAGAITIGAGATGLIDNDYFLTSFTNTGSITVAAGGSLNIGGALTTAQLLSIKNNGGSLAFSGVLTNSGSTLTIGAGQGLSNLTLGDNESFATALNGDQILGGTIQDANGVMRFSYGLLTGVTYEGVLNLIQAGAGLRVTGGLTVTGASGVGAGVINLTSDGAVFEVQDTETLDNATLNIGSATGDRLDELVAGDTLTLGAHFNVVQVGAVAEIGGAQESKQQVVNNGVISAGVAGGAFTIASGGFLNNGSIIVSNGDTVQIGAITQAPGRAGSEVNTYQKFNNLVGSTLTGGIYEVDAGSTLEAYVNVRGKQQAITTDNATIILNGAGSVFEAAINATGGVATLEQSLTKIAAGAVLELLGARNWTSTLALTNAGTLDLAGGVFTQASVKNIGVFSGYGIVDGAFNNMGSVNVVGGDLKFDQAVTGKGAVNVAAAQTLTFESADNLWGAITLGVGSTVDFEQANTGRATYSLAAGSTLTFKGGALGTVNFNDGGAGASLDLGAVASFAAAINGFGASDSLDLLNTAATKATWKNGKLTILNGTATVATIKLAGSYAGDIFSVSSDQHGGSLIKFTQATAAFAPSAGSSAVSSLVTLSASNPAIMLASAA